MSERRRAEIQEKRARLAQLKQAREDREHQARAAAAASLLSASGLPPPPSPGSSSSTADTPLARASRGSAASRTDEIDSLLRTVGVARDRTSALLHQRDSAASALGSSTASRAASSAAGEAEGAHEPGEREAAESSAAPPPPPPVAAVEHVDTDPTWTAPSSLDVSAAPTLSSSSIEVYSLPPKPKVVYDKGIQTSFDLVPHASSSTSTSTSSGTATTAVTSETADALRARILAELEAERAALDAAIASERRLAQRALDAERAAGLAPPQLATVLSSPAFAEFVETSSKVVQRALSDSYDYLRDYAIGGAGAGEDEDGEGEGDGARRSRCRLVGRWRDETWGRGRSVTGLDWSHKFPELFVASYNKNPMAVNEPDGIAAVWNLHLLERPEFVFHAQSDILSVSFSPFHPNLVVGGTYSGQVLVWDTRSRHSFPVLKTPLSSSSGHTHPIYSLELVGTPNAHSLVTASTDGTVCAWALDMLARPNETLELVHPQHNKTDEVSITALGLPRNADATTTLFAGTEEGTVYPAHRYDRAGAKAGIVPGEAYRGHAGPVTGIDFHPVEGSVDLSDLFLTSGVDWTVKLWRVGGSHGAAAAASSSSSGSSSGAAGGASRTSASAKGASSSGTKQSSSSSAASGGFAPLLSFEEADDYVYDVRWHPHHPALFGSVDGAGRFDVWNLNVDTEVPLLRTLVGGDPRSSTNPNGTSSSSSSSSPRRGLNKLAWDRSREGRRAAVGSADGSVYVYELAQDVVTPREGEWEQMRKTCTAALRAQQQGGGYDGGSGSFSGR
ncbi:hypothetical protein JCM8208_000869 [Rhodotorula glutinis]